VVLIVAGVLMNRSLAKCPPAVETRTAAPDSSHEAVTFHFECGFGRKGTTNVSIVPAGGAVVYPPNLFSAMDSSGVNLLLGREVRPAVDVAWEGPGTVLIRYQAGARVVMRNVEARGVKARYEERE
jgi:hypothetical protein